MSIEVRIPTILRTYTGGEKAVTGDGGSLAALIEDLEAKHEHLAAAGDTAWASSFPPPLPSVPPYSDESPTRPSQCSWWCVPACGPTDTKSELDWTCGGAGCDDAECPPVEMGTDILRIRHTVVCSRYRPELPG